LMRKTPMKAKDS